LIFIKTSVSCGRNGGFLDAQQDHQRKGNVNPERNFRFGIAAIPTGGLVQLLTSSGTGRSCRSVPLYGGGE